jgi:hypothetical protein
MLPSFSFTEGLPERDGPVVVGSLSTTFLVRTWHAGEIEGEIAEGAILKAV